MNIFEGGIISRIVVYVDDPSQNKPLCLYAKQHDMRSRYINITLMTASGKHPVSGTCQLNVVTPNDEHIFIIGENNQDGTVTFCLTDNMLSNVGNLSCDVSVFREDDSSQILLTSSTFYIVVCQSNYDADAMEGADDPSTVTQMLSHMSDMNMHVTKQDKDKWDGKQDKIADAVDEMPMEGSSNLVTSGGVFNFVNSQRNKTYKLFYSVDIDNDSTGIVQVPNIDTTDDICVMVDIPGAEDAQTSDRFRINISNKSNGSYPLLYFIDTNAFSTTEQAFCYELVLVGTVYKAYKTSIVAQSNYALSSSTVTLGTYHASYDNVFGKYIDGTVKFMTIQRIKGSGSSSDPQTFPIGTKIRVFTKE